MNQANADIYVCEEVRRVERLHRDLLTDEYRKLPIRDQLDLQARRILEAHAAGDETVATHVTCWHPSLVGSPVKTIMAHELTLDDARETIAREYGFNSWADAEQRGQSPPDSDFERAVDAILAGDVASLRTLLQSKPWLVHAKSDFGHGSTLLHYCGANGVETYRQVVPRNLAEVTQVLIDAGADVNATAEMYGGDCTAIALLITSSFPAEAGVVDDVVRILVDAGAETGADEER